MQVRGGPSGAHGDPLAEHLHHLVEVAALQGGEGRCPAHQGEQVVLRPGLAGALGDDLLSEDVQRRHGRVDAVQPAGGHGADEGGALQQLVPGGGEQAALGGKAQGVAGAAYPLEEGGDAAGRLQLTDQVHRADVYPQLQRGRGDQRLHLARLEALLQRQPALFGEAPVVGGDVLFVQTLGQVVGHPLRQAAGVHEYQSSVMGADQLRQAVVDVTPLLGGADGLEVGRRHLDAYVEVALVAGVYDRAVRRAVPACGGRAADQEAGRLLDGALGGGEADA